MCREEDEAAVHQKDPEHKAAERECRCDPTVHYFGKQLNDEEGCNAHSHKHGLASSVMRVTRHLSMPLQAPSDKQHTDEQRTNGLGAKRRRIERKPAAATALLLRRARAVHELTGSSSADQVFGCMPARVVQHVSLVIGDIVLVFRERRSLQSLTVSSM
jgi:hypothetical protein